MENMFSNEAVTVVLREAEIEEHHCPKALSAAESNARIHEIFEHWGIDYKLANGTFRKIQRDAGWR